MRDHTIFITQDSRVTSVTMDSNGSGYDFAPTVVFTSVDAGYGAAGIAKTAPAMGGGLQVIGVQITSMGQGYSTAPLVSFTGGISGFSLWVVVPPVATAVLGPVKYPIDSYKDIALLSEEGFGMPPIEYITQRGPFQHGESLRDYFLRPRILQLAIRRNMCSRDAYWTKRLELLDILRPNRVNSACAIQGTLRRITSSGQTYDLDVVVTEGPGFAQSNDRWDMWSYQEVIRFIANDPTFYNPVAKSVSFTLAPNSIIFGNVQPPANTVFGWVFGYANSIVNVINYGSWITYPTIIVNGPMNSFSIVNNTTGKHIALAYDIPTGYYVQIGLTYGRKYVQLNTGVDLIGSVSGDLATFRLEPGNNEIEVRGVDYDPLLAPQVTMSYNERFIGI